MLFRSGTVSGLPLSYLGIGISFVLPFIALHRFVAAWRDPSIEALIDFAIAVMAAVLFGGVAHVWPWYLVWALALAALNPAWWLSRFVIAVSIAFPFLLVTWWIAPLDDVRDLIGFTIYAAAALRAASGQIGRAHV